MFALLSRHTLHPHQNVSLIARCTHCTSSSKTENDGVLAGGGTDGGHHNRELEDQCPGCSLHLEQQRANVPCVADLGVIEGSDPHADSGCDG